MGEASNLFGFAFCKQFIVAAESVDMKEAFVILQMLLGASTNDVQTLIKRILFGLKFNLRGRREFRQTWRARVRSVSWRQGRYFFVCSFVRAVEYGQ